jgi:hypothetical protein
LTSHHYWLVLERPEPSVCFHDPGFEPDLLVMADTVALHRIWIGRLSFEAAIRSRLVEIDGPPALARAFPSWLALGSFANVPPATAVAIGRADSAETKSGHHAESERR